MLRAEEMLDQDIQSCFSLILYLKCAIYKQRCWQNLCKHTYV